jgi:hypothetical protein
LERARTEQCCDRQVGNNRESENRGISLNQLN